MTVSYSSVSSTAVISTRGFMMAAASVLTKFTIPDNITRSSSLSVWVISTASANSSSEISRRSGARSLMRLPVRTRIIDSGRKSDCNS